MQKITVKDPYYGKYEVEIEDDAPQEVIDEVIAFMDRNCRGIWAKDKYEQRHAPFSTDALVYEGEEYADTDTPESIYVGYEDEAEKEDDEENLNRYLSVLTETQRKRIQMRWKGLSFKQIADIEGTDSSSVRESVYAVLKKLKKKFPNKF